MIQNSSMRLSVEFQTIPHMTSRYSDDSWCQPPLSELPPLPAVTRLIDEIYAVIIEDNSAIDELFQELQVWEQASDEDFKAFEESLRDATG